MKKIIIIMILVSVGLLLAEGFSINTPGGSISMTVTDDASGTSISSKTVSVESLISEIVKELESLERIHSKLNKFDQRKAQNIINDIYEKLAMLPDDGAITINAKVTDSPQASDANVSINVNVTGDVNETVTPRPEPVEDRHVPMNRIDFNSWKKKIANESFADDQLRIVKMGAKNGWFDCGQVKEILSLFNFADDKLSALRIMWPRVTDKENSYSVIDSFEFSDDKEDAETIMQ